MTVPITARVTDPLECVKGLPLRAGAFFCDVRLVGVSAGDWRLSGLGVLCGWSRLSIPDQFGTVLSEKETTVAAPSDDVAERLAACAGGRPDRNRCENAMQRRTEISRTLLFSSGRMWSAVGKSKRLSAHFNRRSPDRRRRFNAKVAEDTQGRKGTDSSRCFLFWRPHDSVREARRNLEPACFDRAKTSVPLRDLCGFPLRPLR